MIPSVLPEVAPRRATVAVAAVATMLAAVLPPPVLGQLPERLFYTRDSEAAIRSLEAHADRIDVIAPQSFGVREDGIVQGRVPARIMEIAAERGLRVLPLIHNPGFDQQAIHGLLDDAEARGRVVASLVRLAAEEGYWGWQFDFENIDASYRDAFTAFYSEAAEALHAAGFVISVAVVPWDGEEAASSFHGYMERNWRGVFDVVRLAEIGDFVSWMTYAQNGTASAPGPVAGLPWMRTMIDRALRSGVPPEKLSVGIPTFSGHWRSVWDEERGARGQGREIHWDEARALVDRPGAEHLWLPDQGTTMSWYEDAQGAFEWVFMEDARAFRAKLGLIEEYPGLRGFSVWVLGAEDPGIWDAVPR